VAQRLWKARSVTDVAGAVSPVLGGLVRELDRAAPTDLVEVCRTWVVENLGVQECALLLADYSETTLEPVPGAESSVELPRLDVDKSAAELHTGNSAPCTSMCRLRGTRRRNPR
jgi:hypothetical protein